MSDEYVRVQARIERRTAKAVMLSVGEGVRRGAWIPRSCVHGVDDKKIDEAKIGDDVELRMFEWIAEREGFL